MQDHRLSRPSDLMREEKEGERKTEKDRLKLDFWDLCMSKCIFHAQMHFSVTYRMSATDSLTKL